MIRFLPVKSVAPVKLGLKSNIPLKIQLLEVEEFLLNLKKIKVVVFHTSIFSFNEFYLNEFILIDR